VVFRFVHNGISFQDVYPYKNLKSQPCPETLNKKAMLSQGDCMMPLFALSRYMLSLSQFRTFAFSQIIQPGIKHHHFNSILRCRHMSIILLVCRMCMIKVKWWCLMIKIIEIIIFFKVIPFMSKSKQIPWREFQLEKSKQLQNFGFRLFLYFATFTV